MAKSSWTSAVILVLATTSAAAQQPPDQQQPPAAPPTTAVAAAVPPPPPPQDDGGFIEKTIKWADDHQLIERLSGDIDGWYPRLGGMTRGSGFAIGPGYRTHLGSVFVDLSGAISFKNYRAVDAKVRWFQIYDERFEFWTNYRLEDFPEEDFYGRRGMQSLESNRVSYDLDTQNINALALYKPWSWFETGVRFGYATPRVGPGKDQNFPSIEEIFDDVEASGLIQQPNFLYTTVYADVDYTDEPKRPRSGGFYHADMEFWNDRTFNLFDFKRVDAIVNQYFPVDRNKKHVFLGRIGVSVVNNSPGNRVPFYYLPWVGGVDTIRAFNEFRFRDENALWMTAEYNYVLMKWVTLATFADTGQVAPGWDGIQVSNFKGGYGFGVRVHSETQTFARIDAGGGGGEGWRVFLKLGPSW